MIPPFLENHFMDVRLTYKKLSVFRCVQLDESGGKDIPVKLLPHQGHQHKSHLPNLPPAPITVAVVTTAA